ncbi:hypothetical protein DV454_003895 [Geotrichum candidum]|nr:hypothetical protein DV454_003895 [Geotrichum candidum]
MAETTETAAPRRRFVGRKNLNSDSSQPITINETSDTSLIHKKSTPNKFVSQIPSEILNDEELNKAIAILPSNYNFEIHKSVWHIRKSGAKRVALQLPEGLLLYSCIISDILEQFCGVEMIVMGDVTYGACCIDDFTAIALGCDFLIHYAHSCLVPVDVTKIKVLYVFVTINIDTEHLVNTLSHNFKSGSRLALVSTIQFNPTIHDIHTRLLQDHGITTNTPQTKPLSKGEVLGCTSAKLPSKAVSTDEGWDAIVYVGDGRFHLESAMIHNPDIPAYKYDPYSRKFTIEEYDTVELDHARRAAIAESRSARKVGLILGALGRQGNNATLNMLYEKFRERDIQIVQVVLSEIFPGKLAQFPDVDFWVQVACPRLSIDWGYAFPKPLLTPYEAMVSLKEDEDWKNLGYYPMDYYSKDGYGRGKKPIRA